MIVLDKVYVHFWKISNELCKNFQHVLKMLKKNYGNKFFQTCLKCRERLRARLQSIPFF